MAPSQIFVSGDSALSKNAAAATALIGVAGTTVSFFKSPPRENAKITLKASAGGVAFSCRAFSEE